ncbi:capsid vertex protein [Acinetobacter phage vB_AbaM_Konradin]|uniref:Capsid vertex protein n=1 Tax=Acinetobacter phage vB_AbaM_Konradin TaxID=2666257 RepID=A0A650EV10_9CAUD|nr:capsid vertex protein [Acinetobacter phage vB_AbaM_Konradin]QGT53947.1 capsid vertex protein [Acinetobacter phage vB_AbaM_Konradin]
MNQKHIDKLMIESVQSSDSLIDKPALLGLTRATTNLVYHDLVATQYTDKPIAALFGVKYLNPNKELTFVTGATYGGAYGEKERASMVEATVGMTPLKGTEFKHNNIVYKVLVDDPFAGITETELDDIIAEAVILSTIRLASEAAETSKFEAEDSSISDSRFEINRWQANVKSRKLKTELSVELAQDLEAAGFDTAELLEDLLATQMAEEINKDIMQSLITVSRRFKIDGAENAILDLSAVGSSVDQARNLYRYVCEMNANIQKTTAYSATFVLASARVAALLCSSGWVKANTDETPDASMGVLKNGLALYSDNNSPVDYIIVGVKSSFGEQENVGSLFYAPYVEGRPEGSDPTDHVGAYKVINDPNSLQPKIMLLIRYALSVNPYTVGLTDAQAKVVDSTNLDNFAGQSDMSIILGVKLPKLK